MQTTTFVDILEGKNQMKINVFNKNGSLCASYREAAAKVAFTKVQALEWKWFKNQLCPKNNQNE